MIEFKNEEIPEKNPNPKNDIYRLNGASGDDKIMMGGVVFAILCIIVGLSFRDKTTLTLSVIFGGLLMYICIHLFYVKHFLRKKAIKNGKAYPAVIKRSFSYEKRRGTTYASTIHYTMYGIEVIYRNGAREFKGYDVDAKKCLENSYCTVYEWKNRLVVADFKVSDKYISKDGKSYSLKPVKKE